MNNHILVPHIKKRGKRNQKKKALFEGCLKKAKNKAIIHTINIELGEKFFFVLFVEKGLEDHMITNCRFDVRLNF